MENTERHITHTMLILFFLCSRSSGDTKGKNQKLWAPTPGFLTGYHKMTCLVRLFYLGWIAHLEKRFPFVFPVEWLILAGTM